MKYQEDRNSSGEILRLLIQKWPVTLLPLHPLIMQFGMSTQPG